MKKYSHNLSHSDIKIKKVLLLKVNEKFINFLRQLILHTLLFKNKYELTELLQNNLRKISTTTYYFF